MEIAVVAGMAQTTVHRFEAGDGWRRETDSIVAAYEKLRDMEERELWRRAVDQDIR